MKVKKLIVAMRIITGTTSLDKAQAERQALITRIDNYLINGVA